jgi:hypothetical protein
MICQSLLGMHLQIYTFPRFMLVAYVMKTNQQTHKTEIDKLMENIHMRRCYKILPGKFLCMVHPLCGSCVVVVIHARCIFYYGTVCQDVDSFKSVLRFVF